MVYDMRYAGRPAVAPPLLKLITVVVVGLLRYSN